MTKKFKNPWTHQDEGDHFPMVKEWWTFETLFKTIEDKRKWNLITTFAYEMETPSCFFMYVLFDITNKKYLFFKEINDKVKKLSYTKNKVDLKYEKSWARGLYPNYDLHVESDKKDFLADIKYNAKSLPHWSAQDITNGYLPMAFDYMRYGWLLNADLSGKLRINNDVFTIDGKGYLERAWGNWSYKNPFQKLSDLKKTISTYGKLGIWWLSQRKPGIPRSFSLTTENNVFGYDWFWGVTDNEWSIFFGNLMFWLSRGPSFGVFSVTPDGKEFWDFANAQFHYNKLLYVKEYDFYYPTDMEVTGVLNDKKIHLHVWGTTDPHEYIYPHSNENGFYNSLSLLEVPGRMEGTYTDSEKTIKLKGDCKIVPQRQSSKLGHNSIRLDLSLPPKGFGFDIDFNSHHLKKRIKSEFHVLPHPSLKFKIKKLKKEDFSKEIVNI